LRTTDNTGETRERERDRRQADYEPSDQDRQVTSTQTKVGVVGGGLESKQPGIGLEYNKTARTRIRSMYSN